MLINDNAIRKTVFEMNLALRLAKLGAYMALGNVIKCSTTNLAEAEIHWIGHGLPRHNSRSPWLVGQKLAEVVWDQSEDRFVLSPVPACPWSSKYKGGARFDERAVAISYCEDEKVDQFFALMGLLLLWQPGILHHVGVQRPNMDAAKAAARRMHGEKTIVLPAPDGSHERIYTAVRPSDNAIDARLRFAEQQVWPDPPKMRTVHFDLCVAEPMLWLEFMATALGGNATLFRERTETDPIGVFWLTSEVMNLKIGMMTRSEWFDPFR